MYKLTQQQPLKRFLLSIGIGALFSVTNISSVMAASTQEIITLKNGTQVRLKDDFTWEYIITEQEEATKTQISTSSETSPPQKPEELKQKPEPTKQTTESPNISAPATATIASSQISENVAKESSDSIKPEAADEPVTSHEVVSIDEPVASEDKTAQSQTMITPIASEVRLTKSAMAQESLFGQTAHDGIKIKLDDISWKDDKAGLIFTIDSTNKSNIVQLGVEAQFFDDQGVLMTTKTLNVWQAIKRLPETYLRYGQTRQSATIWVEGIESNHWQKQYVTLKIKDISTW